MHFKGKKLGSFQRMKTQFDFQGKTEFSKYHFLSDMFAVKMFLNTTTITVKTSAKVSKITYHKATQEKIIFQASM